MTDETLEIDGKNFVSSARAAQLVGYTKDYVGQLARAGKLDARLIGRSWYVAEDSIRQHKLSVHYTLKQQKKVSRLAKPTGEIPNKNKDISVNQANGKVQTKSVALDSLRQSGGQSGGTSAGIRSVSKAESTLVDSEIRFEEGESLSYDGESHIPEVRREHTTRPSVTSTDRVPEQNEVQMSSVQFSMHGQHDEERARTDDMQVRRVKQTQKERAVYDLPAAKTATPPRRMKVQNGRLVKAKPKQQARAGVRRVRRKRKFATKQVPVVAAVLFFVMYVLWYFFTK